MKDKIIALKNKLLNRETIAYLIVGFCTFLVSIGTYGLYTRLFGMNEHLAKFLSMATAMVFAFYPNKVWVFNSQSKTGRGLLREIWTFFSTRILSVALEQGLFFVFFELMRMHDVPANIIVMVIIVVVNYLFAKFYVFKEKKSPV